MVLLFYYKWRENLYRRSKKPSKINGFGNLTIAYPLTYKGEEENQTAIRESVELARQIPDKNVETFILSGILAFTDKVINEKTRNHIKEVLSMTQVGKMLMDEGIEKGREEERAAFAKKMIRAGKTEEEIIEFTELTKEQLEALKKELEENE